jgi:hypothetical protein
VFDAVPYLDRIVPFVLAILLVGTAAFNVHRRSSRELGADSATHGATGEPSLHVSGSSHH